MTIINRFVGILSWSFLLVVIIIYSILFVAGDRWWPATLVLFGPRWLLLLPIIAFLPWAFWKSSRVILPLVFALLIVFGPIMGFRLSLKPFPSSAGRFLRIITCNIQNGKFDHAALCALIESCRPDLVALQECPRDIKLSLPDGWQMIQQGELAVLSRYPFSQAEQSFHAFHPPHTWPRNSLLVCRVHTKYGDFVFVNLHLPSPRYGLSHILDRKTVINLQRKQLLVEQTLHRRRTATDISSVIARLQAPVIIAGDFNMPVESTIYRELWGRYANAFSNRGNGFGWTHLVTVKGVTSGTRIDHVLVDKKLRPSYCQVGSDVGSDHRPVIADIELP